METVATPQLDSASLAEFLRRRQIATALAQPTDLNSIPKSNIQPQVQAPTQVQGAVPPTNPTISAPVPDTPDTTYRKFVSNVPQLNDYKPSGWRRALAGISGVAAGLTQGTKYATAENPGDIVRDIEQAPYQKAMYQYNTKAQALKEAGDEYLRAQHQKSLDNQAESAATERSSRAKEEEAKGRREDYLSSPQAVQDSITKIQAKGNGALQVGQLAEFTDQEGNKHVGSLGTDGYVHIKTPTGDVVLGQDAIKSFDVKGGGKELVVHPPSLAQQALNAVKANDPKTLANIQRAEAVVQPPGAVNLREMGAARDEADIGHMSKEDELSQERELRETTKQYGDKYSKAVQTATDQLQRIDNAEGLLKEGMVGNNLAAPALLAAVVSGQGTGVRINQAEINQIMNARGIQGSAEAFFNKINGTASLSKLQVEQMRSILEGVKQRVMVKQRIHQQAVQGMGNATDKASILAADKQAQDELSAYESGNRRTQTDGKGNYRHSVDGGKTWLPGQ
jgi:hypothetical protein